MEKYEALEIEVICFDAEDVITTSANGQYLLGYRSGWGDIPLDDTEIPDDE